MRQHPGLCPYWGRCRGYIVVVAPDFAAAVDAVMADDEPAPSAGNDDAHATAG